MKPVEMKFKLIIHRPPDLIVEAESLLCELTSDIPFQTMRKGEIVVLANREDKRVKKDLDQFKAGELLEVGEVKHSMIPNKDGVYDTQIVNVFTKIHESDLKKSKRPESPLTIEISIDRTLEEAVAELEKKMILTYFRNNKGNVSKTAQELGLTRRGLYIKLERHKVSLASIM